MDYDPDPGFFYAQNVRNFFAKIKTFFSSQIAVNTLIEPSLK